MSYLDLKDNNYEDNLREFFKDYPKEINSIQLVTSAYTTNQLFDKLISILKDALKYFYGNDSKKINYTDLTSSQIININKYFNSFGIQVNFKILTLDKLEKYEKYIIDVNITESNFIDGDNSKDNEITLLDILDYNSLVSNTLEDRRFRLIKKSDVYVIWFNYIY